MYARDEYLESQPGGYFYHPLVYRQAFLDDFCATAAESLLKHVLLRAKGRVALRRLGSSAISPPTVDNHSDLLGKTTSSTPFACASKEREIGSAGNDDAAKENGDETSVSVAGDREGETIDRKAAAVESRPLVVGEDEKSDNDDDDGYDDEDDAFDDSNVDDDEEEPIPPPLPRTASCRTATPAVAPIASPTSPAVPSVNSVAGDTTDPAPAAHALPSSSPSANATIRDDPKLQQHQLRPPPEAPATPSPEHTTTTATTTATPLAAPFSTAATSPAGGENNSEGGRVLIQEQQGWAAHPTDAGGKDGGDDGGGELRRQAPPVSARRRVVRLYLELTPCHTNCCFRVQQYVEKMYTPIRI